jgi:hypothetical protein
MRRLFATAAVAGVMAMGFAAGPALASTTATQTSSGDFKSQCFHTRVFLADFHVLDSAKSGKHDGLFSLNDARVVQAGKVNASGDLMAAVNALLAPGDRDSVNWWSLLDTAYKGQGSKDGLVSRKDLNAFLDKYCGGR